MGMLFIYLLVFIGAWAYSKSPIIAGGVVAILWSVLHFFTDRAQEKRDERMKVEQYAPQTDLFRNGPDED
ncbi:MAG: hypothetical protein K2Q12_06905 [Rickettsiales bacterium]|nr:hypothetical protein [Rickettsiales bacterium]